MKEIRLDKVAFGGIAACDIVFCGWYVWTYL